MTVKLQNGRFFLNRGYSVTLVDRDISAVLDLRDNSRTRLLAYDLEKGAAWPFAAGVFSGVIVINYLYRPLFPDLLRSLQPGGVVLYQTFAHGNEKFGRPRNPEYLLEPDELLKVFRPSCEVVAFEQGFKAEPDRVVQAICAVKRA